MAVDDDGEPLLAGTADGEICLSELPFRRGDPDANGQHNITDGIVILLCLFRDRGHENCKCEDALDANDDGEMNLTDAVALLRCLFADPSTCPPAPFPGCGLDPSPDSLSCPTYSGCAGGQCARGE